MRPTRLKPRPTPVVLATAGWVATSKKHPRGVGRGPNGLFCDAGGSQLQNPLRKSGSRVKFAPATQKMRFCSLF